MKKIFMMILLLSAGLFADTAWQKNIPAALSLAQKEHKLVMVLVEGENCRWCKKMKQHTLSDIAVENRLKNYIAVKVFRENEEEVKSLPEIKGVPTIFFMTPEKVMLESVIGYYNVEDFISYINDVEKQDKRSSLADSTK